MSLESVNVDEIIEKIKKNEQLEENRNKEVTDILSETSRLREENARLSDLLLEKEQQQELLQVSIAAQRERKNFQEIEKNLVQKARFEWIKMTEEREVKMDEQTEISRNEIRAKISSLRNQINSVKSQKPDEAELKNLRELLTGTKGRHDSENKDVKQESAVQGDLEEEDDFVDFELAEYLAKIENSKQNDCGDIKKPSPQSKLENVKKQPQGINRSNMVPRQSPGFTRNNFPSPHQLSSKFNHQPSVNQTQTNYQAGGINAQFKSNTSSCNTLDPHQPNQYEPHVVNSQLNKFPHNQITNQYNRINAVQDKYKLPPTGIHQQPTGIRSNTPVNRPSYQHLDSQTQRFNPKPNINQQTSTVTNQQANRLPYQQNKSLENNYQASRFSPNPKGDNQQSSINPLSTSFQQIENSAEHYSTQNPRASPYPRSINKQFGPQSNGPSYLHNDNPDAHFNTPGFKPQQIGSNQQSSSATLQSNRHPYLQNNNPITGQRRDLETSRFNSNITRQPAVNLQSNKTSYQQNTIDDYFQTSKLNSQQISDQLMDTSCQLEGTQSSQLRTSTEKLSFKRPMPPNNRNFTPKKPSVCAENKSVLMPAVHTPSQSNQFKDSSTLGRATIQNSSFVRASSKLDASDGKSSVKTYGQSLTYEQTYQTKVQATYQTFHGGSYVKNDQANNNQRSQISCDKFSSDSDNFESTNFSATEQGNDDENLLDWFEEDCYEVPKKTQTYFVPKQPSKIGRQNYSSSNNGK